MTTEYEWNGLRVRRDEQGKWLYRSERVDTVWLPLRVAVTLHASIAAELDKLYPRPRTVTFNGAGAPRTYQRSGSRKNPSWVNVDCPNVSLPVATCWALDRIWELENGEDRSVWT